MGQFHEFVWITLATYAGCFLFAGVFGVAVWVIRRKQDAATRPIRDAAFVAQASADIRRG